MRKNGESFLSQIIKMKMKRRDSSIDRDLRRMKYVSIEVN